MTEDELDDYFWERLAKAKLVCYFNPSDENDEPIGIEWGVAFGDEKGEKIYFNLKEVFGKP